MNYKIEDFPPLCSLGWHNGTCCCNCIHHKKLMCHPWNISFGKGSASEQFGWVCDVFAVPELLEDGEEPVYQFQDRSHSICELHAPNTECEEALIAIKRAHEANLWE